MTVERRDKKSDRRRTRWGVRTGMVALLTVVGGCGHAYIRPQESGVPAEAKIGQVSQDDPALPGDPTARLAALGKMAKGGGPVEIGAVEPLARQVRDDKNGPLFSAPTVWNGWKVPPARSDTAVSSTAPAPSPAPASVAALASAPATAPALATTSPGSETLPSVPSLSQPAVTDPAESGNPLQTACRETRIAPPRSATGGATDDPGSTQLLSACRDTKIAPPLRKEASVPAQGGSEPVDGLMAACRDAKIAPLRQPSQVVTVASPTSGSAASTPVPSPPVAARATVAEATKPEPATVAEVPKPEPAPVATKPEPATVAEAPKVEPAAAAPEVEPVPVAETPKAEPVPSAEAPKAAPAAVTIVESPMAKTVPAQALAPIQSPVVVDKKPAAVEPVLSSLGPAVAPAPVAAPAESSALTQPAELPALSAVANDTLQAASAASGIELPQRPAAVPPVPENATKAAAAMASQGLASPATLSSNPPAPAAPDSLVAASRASNIPLPIAPTPGTLEDACRKTNLPLPIPASDQ